MFGYGMPGPRQNRPSEIRISPDFGSPLYFRFDSIYGHILVRISNKSGYRGPVRSGYRDFTVHDIWKLESSECQNFLNPYFKWCMSCEQTGHLSTDPVFRWSFEHRIILSDIQMPFENQTIPQSNMFWPFGNQNCTVGIQKPDIRTLDTCPILTF